MMQKDMHRRPLILLIGFSNEFFLTYNEIEREIIDYEIIKKYV
jgi:hypothetical protein